MSEAPNAALVQPCEGLDATIDFFLTRLGFRLETIFPADDPDVAILDGHGLRLRLERGSTAAPAILRLPRSAGARCDDDNTTEILAPNGTRVLLVDQDIPDFDAPVTPKLIVEREDVDGDAWIIGRAGMRYRDLIPGRWNGHIVASHIRIPVGGPVPDYVHYHDVRFQMIYCHRGWVRVVYEDQGEPFVMHPGDCVLQPPGIRHRVLEASDGLEVVEIGCPALHATHVDHAMTLPSLEIVTDRLYGGQRFTRHVAAESPWSPGADAGFEFQNLGIGPATDDLARVLLHRAARPGASESLQGSSGFRFLFVLAGALSVDPGGEADAARLALATDDAVTLPPGPSARITATAADTRVLEIMVAERAFRP